MMVSTFWNRCRSHCEEEAVISMEYHRINGVVRRQLRAYWGRGKATGADKGIRVVVDVNFLMRCIVCSSFPYTCVCVDFSVVPLHTSSTHMYSVCSDCSVFIPLALWFSITL